MQKELQIKLGKKVVYTCTWRSVLYTLCFFLLCVIDQRIKTCSGLDGLIETFRNLTGVVIAVLIISHYKWSDFTAYKVPYLALAGACAVGGALALVCGWQRVNFFNGYVVAVLDVILFCFIAMHTFIAVVLEKKRPALKKSFLAVWAVMMALMIVSRSNYIWPVCFLVMFGCFYLTDFTEDEQADMLQGLMNGIILGFFVMQGLCFVFRPFDNLRYQGIYHNPNLNALFYLEVLAAVLGKILYVHKKETGRAVKVYYWLGAGVVLAFIFLSIGRSAWVAAFLMVLIFLWALNKVLQKKKFWKNVGILILCTCLMFPVCFSAARYIPTVFHHPIWFWGEYSSDRVHSYDPWNTWKYVELDEFLDAAVGRIIDSFQNLWEHSPLKLKVQAGQIGGEDTSDNTNGALLEAEQEADSFLTRKTIYTYYAKRLNLRGYPEEEQGFQLTPVYHIGHAHNIFLQYGTDFGIPVMILFAVLVVWGAVRLRGAFLKTLDVKKAVQLLYLLVPAMFGMFEFAWGTGSLSITMLFIAMGEVLKE